MYLVFTSLWAAAEEPWVRVEDPAGPPLIVDAAPSCCDGTRDDRWICAVSPVVHASRNGTPKLRRGRRVEVLEPAPPAWPVATERATQLALGSLAEALLTALSERLTETHAEAAAAQELVTLARQVSHQVVTAGPTGTVWQEWQPEAGDGAAGRACLALPRSRGVGLMARTLAALPVSDSASAAITKIVDEWGADGPADRDAGQPTRGKP